MGWLALFVAFLVVAGGLWRIKYMRDENFFSFERKSMLFTPEEQSFYHALSQVDKQKYLVLIHVRLADIVQLREPLNRRKKRIFLYRTQDKYVDFALCDAKDFTVKAVFQLHDKAEENIQTLEHHAYLKSLFEAVDIPLLHFNAQTSYQSSMIAETLQLSLGIEAADLDAAASTQNETLTPEAHQLADIVLNPLDEEHIHIQSTPDDSWDSGVEKLQTATLDEEGMLGYQDEDDVNIVYCPKCFSEMRLRAARKGRRAGQLFYMCSAYPRCKRAIPVEEAVQVASS